jgi:hypothetical protein
MSCVDETERRIIIKAILGIVTADDDHATTGCNHHNHNYILLFASSTSDGDTSVLQPTKETESTNDFDYGFVYGIRW